MLRLMTLRRFYWLFAALFVLTSAAIPQERGEEIVGAISRVDGLTLTIQREGHADLRVQVTPTTAVSFSDSGDRKLFPSPTSVSDLRAGMGVRFVYGTGTLDRVTVHYVPAGHAPASAPDATPTQIKARVVSSSPERQQLRADVAGRTEAFLVEDRGSLAGVRRGDLVVLTVETRGSDRIVTRIDSAARFGVVRQVDSAGGSISIEVDGREVSYRTEDRRLLQGVRQGDRVRYEVEERASGALIVTTIERR